MIIRPIKESEYQYLYDFTKKAFSTAYVSSGDEQDYASNVRSSNRYIKDLEYVVEDGGKIVGDILFSTFPLPYNSKSILLDVACIDIDFRNKGLGQSLIEVALNKATELGYEIVFVAGDPKFYSKMGFRATLDFGLKNTNSYEDKYILCKELKKGVLDNISGPFDFVI